MSSWTLKQELCNLTSTQSLSDALYKIGIISEKGASFSIREDRDWIRGGSETFLFHFWVREGKESERCYLIKACAAFAPGVSSVENILAEWIYRRRIIDRMGVSTPNLFFSGSGVIIEEYIPYELSEVINFGLESQKKIIESMAFYAGVLKNLGFSPINPYGDLRSRGEDVVVIDFGQDLGSPQVCGNDNQDLIELLERKITSYGVKITDTLMEKLKIIYNKAFIGKQEQASN